MAVISDSLCEDSWLSKEGRWAEIDALVTDDMLHAFAIVAPPEQPQDQRGRPQRCRRRWAGIVRA